MRVVIGLLGLCAISLLVTYVVLRPARAIGPVQQHNTEPETESDAPLPDPATVDMNGTLYRCVCGPGGSTIEISVAKESESESGAALPNSARWEESDGTFYRCVCGSGGVSMEISVPTLTLSPDTGTTGQTIRVNGASFARETSVALRLGVPNAGLSKENLATVVVDAHGAFEVELRLPVEWPGTQTPIVERELVIAAVDEATSQTLAVAQFTNAAAVRAEPVPTVHTIPWVEIADTGLSIEVPDGWFRLEQEWAWTPREGSDVRLGVNWMDLQPPMEPEAVMLPAPSQILHSEEVTLHWGQGRRFLLEVYAPATPGSDGKATVESVETHVLAVVRRGKTNRAFDLYVRSSKLVDMEQLDPLLQRVLDTSILAGPG